LETVIVAFAFGAPSHTLSNQRIAQIASRKAQELHISIYTQLDVRIEPDIEVRRVKENPGNPPSTWQIARGVVQLAEQQGFNEILIVAAKPHLPRALRDVERAVREAGKDIKIRVCEEIEQYPEDSWFCPDSTQDRVRSKKKWDKREKIFKLMPFFIYKNIATKVMRY